MSKRPLLIITCVYLLGILYSQFINWLSFGIFILTALISIVLLIQTKHKHYLFFFSVLIVFLFGASYTYLKSIQSAVPLEPFSNNTVIFNGQIVSHPDLRDRKTNYVVLVNKIIYNSISKDINIRVLLYVYNDNSIQPTFKYGDLIYGTGKVQLPSPARNTGAFDYKRFLASQNVYSSIITTSDNLVYRGQAKLNPFISFSLFLRNNIIKIIDSSLPSEQAGLLKGIVIGERGSLSEDTKNDFNISGLTHLLCVSGANIAYIAGACLVVLKILKIKPPYSNFITIIVLIIFTYITGSSPAVMRASIMGIMLLLAEVFVRKSDVLTSISAASLFILIYNPFTFYDIGFQLSFAGTIGIVLFYKNLVNYFNFLPKLINEVFSVSLAAQLTVNPLIALYFNKVSLIAIVSNLLVVPITGGVTILGFIMSILGQFILFPAQIVGGLSYFFLSFMLWVSNICANIPFATIQVVTPSIFVIILYYSILYILLKYVPEKKPPAYFYKGLLSLLIIIVISSLIIFSLPRPLQIYFLDIGQGDSAFIKTPSGSTCLIDGGGKFPGTLSNFDPGNTIIPFLLDNGITSIDLAILSHAHGDHIQGLIKVVEKLYVKKLIIGPQFESNSDLTKLLELCKSKKINVIQVKKGSSIQLNEVYFDVLHPSDSNHYIENSSLNNNSLVLKLKYKNFSILFSGDIENQAEQELLSANIDIKADILKIAHHGSPGSTSDAFLKSVSPSLCIISVGKNNFGHPSKLIINRIISIGSKLYRTDQNGGINIKVYDDKLKIQTAIKN